MKTLIRIMMLLIILNLHISDISAQQKDSSTTSFSFVLNTGPTLHMDGDIDRRSGFIASMSVEYLELGFFYTIDKNFDVGLTFGKNVFTQQKKFYFDTAGFYISNVLINYQWAALNFKVNYHNNWYIGAKIGMMESDFGSSETLLGLFIEKEIFKMQSFYSKLKIEYDARASLSDAQIYSNQINLLMSLGFKL